MEDIRTIGRELIEMLRSNAPEEREKAAVMIYQNGMLDHKRIMEASTSPDTTGPAKKTA